MNNKILILALSTLLAGCATSNISSTLMTGTGSGAAGTGENLNNKASAAENAYQAKPAAIANITDKSISSPAAKIPKPVYPAENSLLKRKKDSLENFDLSKKNDGLKNKQSPNRYSNNSNKNIRSGAPASSAGNPSNYVISGENYKVLPFSNGFVERGVASWYGPDFHGEKTSNGEIYDMHGMTAAHKRLPIPSFVRVTNLKNKRSVVLRINDRGPFYADRVIDLSYAAAQKLDIHQPGTERVQIEAIKTSNKESVYLQLGVFSNPANAELLQKKIVENNLPKPMVKEVRLDGKPAYRVQLGPIFSTEKVNELNAKLAKMGISETWYLTENKIN